MGRFARVSKAEMSGQGNYFPNLPLTYLVKVMECKCIEPRKGGLAFIVEVEVVEVVSPITKTEDARGISVPSAGDKRSWYVDLQKDAGPPDMKRFLDVVTKDDPLPDDDDEFEVLCELAVSKDQPFAGMVLRLVTYNKPTNAGAPFTRHEWSLPKPKAD